MINNSKSNLGCILEWSKGDSWNLVPRIRDSLFFTLIGISIIVLVIIILSIFDIPITNLANIQTLSCFELHDVITEAGETEYNYNNVYGSWEKISAVYGAKCK